MPDPSVPTWEESQPLTPEDYRMLGFPVPGESEAPATTLAVSPEDELRTAKRKALEREMAKARIAREWTDIPEKALGFVPMPSPPTAESERRRLKANLQAERMVGDVAETLATAGEQTAEALSPAGIMNQLTRIASAVTGKPIPDQFAAGRSLLDLGRDPGTGVRAGLENLTRSAIESMATPEGIVTAPAAIGSGIGRAAVAAFLGSGIPELVKEGLNALRDKNATTAEKVEKLGRPVLAAAGTLGLAKSPVPIPERLPRSAWTESEAGAIADRMKGMGLFDEQAKQEQKGITDASKVTEATAVHGNVPTQPGEGEGGVPIPGSGQGIQPPPAGGIPAPKTEPVPRPASEQGRVLLTPKEQADVDRHVEAAAKKGRPVVQIKGPDGKMYRATYDGDMLGQKQFTIIEQFPGLGTTTEEGAFALTPVLGSKAESSLKKAGYEIPENLPPIKPPAPAPAPAETLSTAPAPKSEGGFEGPNIQPPAPEPAPLAPSYIGTRQWDTGPRHMFRLNQDIVSSNGKVVHRKGQVVAQSVLDRYKVRYELPEEAKAQDVGELPQHRLGSYIATGMDKESARRYADAHLGVVVADPNNDSLFAVVRPTATEFSQNPTRTRWVPSGKLIPTRYRDRATVEKLAAKQGGIAVPDPEQHGYWAISIPDKPLPPGGLYIRRFLPSKEEAEYQARFDTAYDRNPSVVPDPENPNQWAVSIPAHPVGTQFVGMDRGRAMYKLDQDLKNTRGSVVYKKGDTVARIVLQKYGVRHEPPPGGTYAEAVPPVKAARQKRPENVEETGRKSPRKRASPQVHTLQRGDLVEGFLLGASGEPTGASVKGHIVSQSPEWITILDEKNKVHSLSKSTTSIGFLSPATLDSMDRISEYAKREQPSDNPWKPPQFPR